MTDVSRQGQSKMLFLLHRLSQIGRRVEASRNIKTRYREASRNATGFVPSAFFCGSRGDTWAT